MANNIFLETDLVDILAGVLQGDTPPPYLFVVVLDYVLKGYSEIIAVTTPSIFIKSDIFAFW